MVSTRKRLASLDHGGGHIDRVDTIHPVGQSTGELPRSRPDVEHCTGLIGDQADQQVKDLGRIGETQVIDVSDAPVLKAAGILEREMSGSVEG